MNRRTGISLIELLVCIAIVAILIAMTIPIVARTRARSIDISCCNNLRQIGIAISGYAAMSSGELFIEGRHIVQWSWPYRLFGDTSFTVCHCPTGEDETYSYMLNGWLRLTHGKLGTALHGRPSSDVVLGGEHLPGLGFLYYPENNYNIVDQRRHPHRPSNTLWLDFHVDHSLPAHPWVEDDPWSVQY
jgi:prepilin-type N-terminal cleavage/methylation domain-containing protein/prepilin-type processing-associated H-X9-DG protein